MTHGDTPPTAQRSVLARTLMLALILVVPGAVASHAASQIIAFLLFQTDPADHLSFISVLRAVAPAAGYFPAERATRIAVALRPK